jgi:hypothetical protein
VLSQKGEDGKKHPIAFYSATAMEAERNYDIYDLELLAIVKACRHWLLRSVGRSVRRGRWGFALNVDKELRGSAVL